MNLFERRDVSLKQADKHVKFSQNNLVRIHLKALDQIQAYLSEERKEMRQKLNPSFSPSSPTHQEIQTSARILDREIKHLGEFNNIYRVTNKTETVNTTQNSKNLDFRFLKLCILMVYHRNKQILERAKQNPYTSLKSHPLWVTLYKVFNTSKKVHF